MNEVSISEGQGYEFKFMDVVQIDDFTEQLLKSYESVATTSDLPVMQGSAHHYFDYECEDLWMPFDDLWDIVTDRLNMDWEHSDRTTEREEYVDGMMDDHYHDLNEMFYDDIELILNAYKIFVVTPTYDNFSGMNNYKTPDIINNPLQEVW